MVQFILGVFIGNFVFLVLYALIIVGKGDDIDNG